MPSPLFVAVSRLRFLNTVAPVIAGPVVIGGSFTITQGTWSGAPTLTYTLYRGSTPDGTAHDLTIAQARAYVIAAADIGPSLTWREIPNGIGASAASSNALTFALSDISGYVQGGDADAAHVTKDGSNRVSNATDLSGSGHDAAQATGGAQPLWVSGGVNGKDTLRFDGSRFLQTGAFALNQPSTVFVSGMITSTSAARSLIDGAGGLNTLRVLSNSGTLAIFAGNFISGSSLTNNVWFVAGGKFQGASGVLSQNGTETTGNSGSSNASGVTIGAGGDQGSKLLGDIRKWAVYSGALTANQRSTVAHFLGYDAGVSIA